MTYEEQPGEVHQVTANLEEISTCSAVVLMEDEPKLGVSISVSLKGRDLFGVIRARIHDTALGWFAVVALDAGSLWNRDWLSPKHLLHVCGCSLKGAMPAKVRASENTRNTEENVPVNFITAEV